MIWILNNFIILHLISYAWWRLRIYIILYDNICLLMDVVFTSSRSCTAWVWIYTSYSIVICIIIRSLHMIHIIGDLLLQINLFLNIILVVCWGIYRIFFTNVYWTSCMSTLIKHFVIAYCNWESIIYFIFISIEWTLSLHCRNISIFIKWILSMKNLIFNILTSTFSLLLNIYIIIIVLFLFDILPILIIFLNILIFIYAFILLYIIFINYYLILIRSLNDIWMG